MYIRQEVVEDIRERMRVETGLVVVGSADDQLRVGKTKKLMEGVTQSMIDRCILVSIKGTNRLFPHVVKIFLSSS
jgi:regulatory NSL complex subunit 3